MSERSDADYLRDIEEAVERIETYTAGVCYERFMDDTMIQDAVIRNLEIIGEATKGLSYDIRAKYPDVPWKGMAGVRDRLIHGYFGVNLEVMFAIKFTMRAEPTKFSIRFRMKKPRTTRVLCRELERELHWSSPLPRT